MASPLYLRRHRAIPAGGLAGTPPVEALPEITKSPVRSRPSITALWPCGSLLPPAKFLTARSAQRKLAHRNCAVLS